MGDYTGCVGDAVTGQRLCVPFIFFKTEYISCRGGHWRRWWQRLIWWIVHCCCHTLRSWHHRHCHRYWQRLLCLYRYLSFSCTFRYKLTYYKNSSRVNHLKRSCSWISTNQWFLLVPVIAPVVDIVEAQKFQTPLATVVEFTRLQRVYNFERDLWACSKLSGYKRERMYRYFKMRTLIVILVVEIFLGLAVESRESISSLGVLNSDIEE